MATSDLPLSIRECLVADTDEEYSCCICIDIFKNPVSCKNGHGYCTPCISTWLQDKRSCPSCKCALSIETLVPMRNVSNLIGKLKVYCANEKRAVDSEEGKDRLTTKKKRRLVEPKVKPEPSDRVHCTWIGTISQLEAHKTKCDLSLIMCQHNGCTETIKRHLFLDHTSSCEYRSFQCPHCKDFCVFNYFKVHLRTCDMFEVGCKLKCGMHYQRRHELAHHQVGSF